MTRVSFIYIDQRQLTTEQALLRFARTLQLLLQELSFSEIFSSPSPSPSPRTLLQLWQTSLLHPVLVRARLTHGFDLKQTIFSKRDLPELNMTPSKTIKISADPSCKAKSCDCAIQLRDLLGCFQVHISFLDHDHDCAHRYKMQRLRWFRFIQIFVWENSVAQR